MKKVSNVLLIAALIALWWASNPEPNKEYSKWGEFAPQVASFVEAGKLRGKTIDISYITIELSTSIKMGNNDLLGLCLPERRTVLINKQYWDIMDDPKREELVWHELGHCVLNREHYNEFNKEGHPISVMISDDRLISQDEVYWFNHRQQILDELFSKTP